MTRARFLFLLTFTIAGLPAAASADDIPDRTEAKVVKIESGEVLVVQLADSNKRVKVRVIGIDCNSKSRNAAAQLVGRSTIMLRSDKGFLPLLEDQFGRYVAYVQTTDGRDLGLELIKTGSCSTTQWTLPHPKTNEYASAAR